MLDCRFGATLNSWIGLINDSQESLMTRCESGCLLADGRIDLIMDAEKAKEEDFQVHTTNLQDMTRSSQPSMGVACLMGTSDEILQHRA